MTLLTMPPTSSTPCRSEIWLVAVDSPRGAEIPKTRPAVVVSADAIGIPPIKLIVPLMGWHPSCEGKLWLVSVDLRFGTGIDKRCTADVFQIRSVGLERFVTRIGRMPADIMEEIAAAITAVVEYQYR
ncbi:MAG: type II toxin-antitoxin system PemK/MazF family toxin [Chloroflexales bacterium]